jgi:hypothetical protein
MEAGFEVYGFDIKPQPDYKGIFIQCDILSLTAEDIRKYGASFATCSSPCEQFSVHCMKHFHPNAKHPEMGIRLFNHARALLEEIDIPHVMENVRCAEKFLGRSVNHAGPFYLWGNSVPAVFPPDAYKVTKGMDIGSGSKMRNMSREEVRAYRKNFDILQSGSKSKSRCATTANAAMIPLPIARAVAETAWNLTQALEVA